VGWRRGGGGQRRGGGGVANDVITGSQPGFGADAL